MIWRSRPVEVLIDIYKTPIEDDRVVANNIHLFVLKPIGKVGLIGEGKDVVFRGTCFRSVIYFYLASKISKCTIQVILNPKSRKTTELVVCRFASNWISLMKNFEIMN